MAVKQKNPGALIGVVMALIGGVMVFSTFEEFFGGIRIFFEALSYGAEFGVAFDAAIRYTGGQFLIGLLGAILLLIGILTVRSSAGRIAKNAAEQGSDAVRRARDEAQQRAEAQQRDNQRRAMEAQQAAQRRVQERQRQVQSGSPGGSAPGGSTQGGSAQGSQGGQSRLDQLRQRVAEDPRMQQMREAANDAGYGDLVNRYVPGQPTPNQVRQQPQQAQQQPQQWGGNQQQAQRQTQQPQQPQPQQPQQRQQPRRQQRGQRQRLQTQREMAESQQNLRQLPDAAAEAAARLAARAREAGMETVLPNERTAPSKRRSALTRSSLSTSALSKTSLSTKSLFRSRNRQISPAAPISSAAPVEELLQRNQ